MSEHQGTLFGSPNVFGGYSSPPAARNDPETSHEAAKNFAASGRKDRHAEIVFGLVERNPLATYQELFAAATDSERRELGDAVAVMRRLSELAEIGRIGRGEARTCRVKNTRMTTWYPRES